MKEKPLQTIISIAVLIGMIISAITYFATAEDVKKVEQRLEQKIQADRFIDTKRMMYEIKKENKDKKIEQWNEKDKKFYNELEIQLEITQKAMEKK